MGDVRIGAGQDDFTHVHQLPSLAHLGTHYLTVRWYSLINKASYIGNPAR